MALKFIPNPTFNLTVDIPVAGQEQPEPINLVVAHLTPQKYSDLAKQAAEAVSAKAGDDAAQVSSMAGILEQLIKGWEWTDEGKVVDVPLTKENFELVMNNYPRFYAAVMEQYGQELFKVRQKN